MLMQQEFISEKSFDTAHFLAPSAWSEHIPFAFWLIEKLNPSVIIELGVHYGVSYFSFCQAVKTNNLSSVCYGVDNWIGDEHAGFFQETIYNDVKKYNDDNYSG